MGRFFLLLALGTKSASYGSGARDLSPPPFPTCIQSDRPTNPNSVCFPGFAEIQ